MTGDEEIASPSSRPIIERVGRAARCVFNSEPGRPSGNVVTSRKGGVFLSFEIIGKAAHSGGNFEAGISAIGELAHKIVALHKLTDLRRGITVNVGLVSGGQSVNTTAPSAGGQIDLRYVKADERAQMLTALQEIVDRATVVGTSARLEIRGEFLPVTSTPKADELFSCYQAAALDAGLRVAGEFSGGCADSGFTAGVGCPTLCGVGPVGGNAHTPEEYLEIDTLVRRAQAMALAILRLPDDAR
jgi:glutamate carboxypeptidase